MKSIAYRLFLLVPFALMLLGIQQYTVLRNINRIATEGTEYLAEVDEFKIKYIASQTNGYVIVRFVTNEGDTLRRKLSLTVQLAARIMETNPLPIRYLPDIGSEVIILPNLEVSRSIVGVNLVIIFVSMLITGFIAWFWYRKRKGKVAPETQFEVVNT
jgi:hypothetical protein